MKIGQNTYIMKYEKPNSWTHFDPLKQVVIGNVYDPSFFDDLKDDSIRESIQKVLRETKEDLDNIIKTLVEHGVEVIQTASAWTQDGQLLKYNSFEEWRHHNPNGSLPKPMINPRDNYITLGDEIFCTWGTSSSDEDIHPLSCFDNVNIELCKQFDPNKLGPFQVTLEGQFDIGAPKTWEPSWDDPKYFKANKERHPKDFSKYVWQTWQYAAMALTRVGDRLIVDECDRIGFYEWYSKIKPNHKHKKNTVAIGGHNDGSMCLVKPGLIIGSPWMKKDFFSKTFPGWDCLIVEDPIGYRDTSIPSGTPERREKKEKRLKWHIENKMKDSEFVKFVDKWLYDWVGMQDETFFEVNMLSLDEKNILTLNYQKEIHDKLKSVGVNPIYTKFRHKRFWDSGLHCLTLDTYREGSCREIN